jgi:hypothetical protein
MWTAAIQTYATFALALRKHFEKFFAFLRSEGVEPTNNSAERALRCAVQWQAGVRKANSPLHACSRSLAPGACRIERLPP